MTSKIPPTYKPPDPHEDLRSLLDFGRRQGTDWNDEASVDRTLEEWVQLETVKAEFKKALTPNKGITNGQTASYTWTFSTV